MSKMIDKQALLECLQREADCYEGDKSTYASAVYGMNIALIKEIESGRFDVKGDTVNDKT